MGDQRFQVQGAVLHQRKEELGIALTCRGRLGCWESGRPPKSAPETEIDGRTTASVKSISDLPLGQPTCTYLPPGRTQRKRRWNRLAGPGHLEDDVCHPTASHHADLGAVTGGVWAQGASSSASAGKPTALGDQIHADDRPSAGSASEPHRQLAQHSQPDHYNRIAKSKLADSEGLKHANRYRMKDGLFGVDVVPDPGRAIGGHNGVAAVAQRSEHRIAHLDAGDASAYCQ